MKFHSQTKKLPAEGRQCSEFYFYIFHITFLTQTFMGYTFSQCGNFRIFLSLRFYVKSILRTLEVQNLPFLTHLEALDFDFHEFLHFLKAEVVDQQINKMTKRVVLELLCILQNRFHVKSECQKILKFSHTVILGLFRF